MAGVFLAISAAVLSVIIIACCVLLLIQFGHPDDKNAAYFPKFITVFGLYLAFAAVLIMPYDVANLRSGRSLRVDILWQIAFILIAVFVVFIIPYTFFFYESDVDEAQTKEASCQGQGAVAFKYACSMLIIFSLILVILYIFINKAEIPVTKIECSAINPTNPCTESEFIWTLPVTFPIYCVALLSFLGWFLFSIFVAIGLVALPLDLINEWRTRPEPITTTEYARRKLEIGRRATQLLGIVKEFEGEALDLNRKETRKTKKMDRKVQAKLETEVYSLDKEYKYLEEAYVLKGGNPVWYFFKLVCGLIAIVISITWIVHICVFVLPTEPLTPLLNNFFIDLEGAIDGFPLFGVTAFGLYSYYLLWCCVKGAFRVGLRIPFVLRIYPMEVGNTMMNAFLFNTWLILICTIPTIQFCAISFPNYANNTEVDLIFGTQVKYLKFFRYFWENNVFVFAMMGLTFLSLVILFVAPRDSSKDIDLRLDRIVKGGDDDDE